MHFTEETKSSSLKCNRLLHISSLITGKSNVLCPRMNSSIPPNLLLPHCFQSNKCHEHILNCSGQKSWGHSWLLFFPRSLTSNSSAGLNSQLQTWMPSLRRHPWFPTPKPFYVFISSCFSLWSSSPAEVGAVYWLAESLSPPCNVNSLRAVTLHTLSICCIPNCRRVLMPRICSINYTWKIKQLH